MLIVHEVHLTICDGKWAQLSINNIVVIKLTTNSNNLSHPRDLHEEETLLISKDILRKERVYRLCLNRPQSQNNILPR